MAAMSNGKRRGCGCGIGSLGFGSVLAMVISFTTWHSVLWAIFHGILGWIYVIYYLIVYGVSIL